MGRAFELGARIGIDALAFLAGFEVLECRYHLKGN